jgi:hypothetical protein
MSKHNPQQPLNRDPSGKFQGQLGLAHGTGPVSFKLSPPLREALQSAAAAQSMLPSPYVRAIVTLVLELKVPSVAWLREAILEKQAREQT